MFKVDDLVVWLKYDEIYQIGYVHSVVDLNEYNHVSYPVLVKFFVYGNYPRHTFTLDGRFSIDDEPTLFLINKPLGKILYGK